MRKNINTYVHPLASEIEFCQYPPFPHPVLLTIPFVFPPTGSGQAMTTVKIVIHHSLFLFVVILHAYSPKQHMT